MPGDIIANSLVNNVKFTLNMQSYQDILKYIRKVKKELGDITKPLENARASQVAATRQVKAVRQVRDAHVQSYKQRRALLYQEARDTMAVEKAIERNRKNAERRQNQVTRAARNKAKGIMGQPSAPDFTAQMWRQRFQSMTQQPSGAGRITAKTSMFNQPEQQMMGPSRALFEQNQRRVAQQSAATQGRIEKKTSAFNFEAQGMDRLKPAILAQYRAQLKQLNNEYRSGAINVGMYNEKIRQLTNGMRRQNRESLTLGERLRSIRSEMLFIGMTAGFAIKSVTDTGRELQNTSIMMNTVFGDQAASQIDFLRSQTERLGISFSESAKNFTKLQFAGTKAGMSISDMQEIFLGVTEASQVFGMSQEEVGGSMKAIIQMFSKGTVQSEELKGQLGDHLVGAYNLAADAMGMTTKELGEQLKAGNIMAKDLIPKLAKGLRELAAPGLSAALQRLDAYFGRLGNSWDRFQKIIYDSGLETFLKTIATAFKQILDGGSPIGAMLGGIFKGLSDIAYAIQLPIALFLDWAETVGLIDKKTGKFIDSVNMGFEWLGRTIGIVFGVIGLKVLGGFMFKLFGIFKWIKRISGAAKAMAIGEALTEAVSAGSVATAGTTAGTVFSGAFLASSIPFVIAGIVSAIATAIGEGLKSTSRWANRNSNMIPQNVPYKESIRMANNPQQMALDLAARKQAEYRPSTYSATGYGAGGTINVVIEEKPGLTQYLKATAKDAVNEELSSNMTGN